MKKILVTRRLLRSCEDKAKEIFDVNFNLNDEISISFDINKSSIFDSKSEERI